MHWSHAYASEAGVGALVSPAVDPISGEPEFKHTPARVEPFPVEWHGVVLTRAERSASAGDHVSWGTLRWTAIASLALWFLTTLTGTGLLNMG